MSPPRKRAPSSGAAIVATGRVPTATSSVAVPGPGIGFPSLTVSVTIFGPAVVYVWFGF